MIFLASPLVMMLALPIQPGSEPEAHVLRGISWLHSFEYEEALEEFRAAQQLDPAFLMAYWGEAMCYSQPLWGREDPEAARRTLSRLGTSPSARAAKAKTARDRGYLAAIERLFGEGDPRARMAAYSQAMKALAEKHPDDLEAQVFYGLSLLALRPRGVAIHDHSGVELGVKPVSVKDDDVSPRAAEIFQRALARNPNHPGALHYLIHTFDDPVNAPRALDAARRYAKVAPEATHALHMPAHIFVQLGEWKDAAASDAAAYRASVEWATRKGLPASMRSFHSLEWLQYEYLQLGEFQKAVETIAEIEPIAAASGSPEINTMVGLMKARQVIESEDWTSLRGQQQYRNYVELYALGFSAAKRGEMQIAEFVRAELAALPANPRYSSLAAPLSILERHMSALIEARAGRVDAAVELMKAAVSSEEARPYSSGPAEPIKPSSELLGEILLEANRPVEAQAAFEAALRRVPGRRLSLSGTDRAKARSGSASADAPLSTLSRRPLQLTAVGVVGLVAVILVARRRRAKPASRQQRRRASRKSEGR
jgi:tetratricopeptide (TPR) repeat protein